MSPSPTITSVLPSRRSGSTWSSQRRWRWASRYVSTRWVTHEHQPITYSAIHGPKMPGARVTTTWGGTSGATAHSTPAPMTWSHLSFAALA